MGVGAVFGGIKVANRKKSVQTKVLNGTVSSDGGGNGNFPIPDKLPDPPDYFNTYAVAAWNYYGKLLLQAGLLTSGDILALELLATAYGRWIEAELKLKETGTVLASDKTGGLYQNPYLGVANRAYEHLMKLLGSFGLNPAERNKVTIAGTNVMDGIMKKLLGNSGEDSNGGE